MTSKLTTVIRLDSMPLTKASFTDEGYLKDRPVLTSTGIFEYHNSDGSIRRELRLPEDVFSEESLQSYKGKPIIITHDAGLITKSNVAENQIGTILTDGYKSGDDVRAEIIIHDTDEMRECGLKELSLGYNLDLEEVAGVWNGEPYDAIQRNIRINHLALVREARAGEQARLNIDSRDADNLLKGGKKMRKIRRKRSRRADGILSPEELAKAIEQYKARRANAMAHDEEEEVKQPIPEPTIEKADEEVNDKKTIEKKMQLVKDRRDIRDENGDPASQEEALGVIANQDEDIDTLFDIIDTLLAKEEYDAADEEPEVAEDEDDEEIVEGETEEEIVEDEDDVEEVAEDEDDEPVDEEITEDEDDEIIEEEVVEDEDDVEEKSTMNADSVDNVVRQRIKIGMIGRMLNMDGLENMKIRTAKKAIIKAVRPKVRLDGKSKAYINAMFECAVDDVKRKAKKDVNYQKKQMFNRDGRSARRSSGDSALAARQRMIDRQQKTKEVK